MNFLEELKWRGLLHQTAGENIEPYLQSDMRVAYCGFDPTADSLTVGNFLAIKMLMQWQRYGHRPIVLMGGGTGLIGDPSGKDSERQLNSFEQVQHNISQQRKIFETLLDFDSSSKNRALLVNNYDWLKDISWIEALRDIGKYFSVNQMIQRDSVKDRLTNREQGISYTEFSYMLLQAYDFLHLYKTQNCTVQLAGSDQYGNIVSGMDLIRRHNATQLQASPVFGITNQLVTKSDGTKIGKTAGNAIWLSSDKTSPYKFYQFWLNTDDSDVIKFLQWFTFLSQEEVQGLQQQHQQAPHLREAHKTLASYMTDLIHGNNATLQAQKASQALFMNEDFGSIDEKTLMEVFEGIPSVSYDKQKLAGNDLDLMKVLVDTQLAESNSRAREFLRNNAISINGKKVREDYKLSSDDLLHGHIILIKRGKKNWAVTRWI